MLLTLENLELKGYNKFTCGYHKADDKYYLTSYQKRFDDKKGKKFFITYHFSEWPKHLMTGKNIALSCSMESQLNYGPRGKSKTVNIHYFVSLGETTVSEVERYINKVWTFTKARHYDLWNDC